MKFIKDLLFFEVSTTGSDPDKDNIIQLSALLLDKDNLLQKDFFDTYIRVSYLDSFMLEHSRLLNIHTDSLKRSPKVYDAVKSFYKKFGTNLLLGTHTLTNILFLKNAFKKAALPFDYDQHTIDLWTLGY